MGRQRNLQPLGMPIPGLGWMHQGENSRILLCHQPPWAQQGVRGCGSSLRVWEVAGALQDQEWEGCDPTQEGLVVLGDSKGLIPLMMDSGLIQEFSNLGDVTLWQPLIRGFGAHPPPQGQAWIYQGMPPAQFWGVRTAVWCQAVDSLMSGALLVGRSCLSCPVGRGLRSSSGSCSCLFTFLVLASARTTGSWKWSAGSKVPGRRQKDTQDITASVFIRNEVKNNSWACLSQG